MKCGSMRQVEKGGRDGLLSLGYTIDGIKWWAERKRQVMVSDPDRRSVEVIVDDRWRFWLTTWAGESIRSRSIIVIKVKRGMWL